MAAEAQPTEIAPDIVRDIEPMMLRATVRPSSVNAEERTFELVWTTGAGVRRYSWSRGEFIEELSLKPRHVRLKRLKNKAPLLNTHNGWDLRGVLGVVEKAWLSDGEGHALVRFPKVGVDEEADRVFEKVHDGIITHSSVGYAVYRYEITEEEGQLPIYRATDWEPFEISMVPMGADDDATVRAARSERRGLNRCEFVLAGNTRGAEMAAPTKPDPQGGSTPAAAPAAPPNPAPASDGQRSTPPANDSPPAPTPAPADNSAEIARAAERAAAEAVRADRERAAEIRRLAEACEIESGVAQRWIDEGVSLEDARRQAIDLRHERRQESTPVEQGNSRVRVEVGDDLTRSGAVDGLRNALLHRGDPEHNELSDTGRMYRAMSLMEMARTFLEAHGVRTRGMSKHQLAATALGLDQRAGGYHSTDDFPLILADVAGKTLRRAYEEQPQTFRAWCRRATLPDFKEVKRTQLGEAPPLVKVPEGAEFTRGTIGEAREVYSLATYGRVFAITRQTLINDDLDAFTRLPMLYGRRARDLESDLVYDHLVANAAMGDGTVLFHADHGNVGTGAIDITSVSDGRKAMRKQTSFDGKRINVMAKYLIVPAELETVAEQLLSTDLLANVVSNVNIFAGKLTPITEPRLDDDSTAQWYLSGDPAAIDTLEYGYLEGEEGVATETRIGFDVDGVEIKARLDFGVKAIDWRGLYRSSGV